MVLCTADNVAVWAFSAVPDNFSLLRGALPVLVRQAAFLRFAQVNQGGHVCCCCCEVSARFHLPCTNTPKGVVTEFKSEGEATDKTCTSTCETGADLAPARPSSLSTPLWVTLISSKQHRRVCSVQRGEPVRHPRSFRAAPFIFSVGGRCPATEPYFTHAFYACA